MSTADRHSTRPRDRPSTDRTARCAGRRAVSGLAAACLIIIVTAAGTAAQGPDAIPDISRWQGRLVHETWTTEDGLPVNSITSLHQTRDGYIWIGTFDGLVRFDGALFTVFNSTNVENLPSNRITQLYEGSGGTLWLAAGGELVRFRSNRFEPIGAANGLTGDFVRLYEDESGRTWLMTTEGLGQVRGDSFVVILPQPLGGVVSRVIQREDGSIWAGTPGAGLYRLTGDPDGSTMDAVPVAALDFGHVEALFEDPSDGLWIGTTRDAWIERNGLSKVESDRRRRSDLRSAGRQAA